MKPNPSMDRRAFLRRVGLVAAATGLPPQFLLRPSIANAGALDAQATFLLLSVSSDGDPLNANLPGSYVPDAMNNPLLPATEVSVGSQRWLAGSPWADASLDRFRSRTCFFHHVCHTAAHTEMAAVLGLHGAVASANGRGFEQLPSMIAQENAAALGTLQQEPIALGRERLSFGGRPLPSIRPQEVAALFLGNPAGGQAASLESLAELRDAAIDDLYRREDFGAPQRAFLDRYAQSRNTARDIGLQIRAALAGLAAPGSADADGPRDQILTALALFRLRLTPVVTIKVPFGGDNHADDGLEHEAEETTAGAAHLAFLDEQLHSGPDPLAAKVTFANLNTFGRSLYNSPDGRAHNGDHHVMMISGPAVRGCVVGGVQRQNEDFSALPINSITGAGGEVDADIEVGDTMAAAGHTLAAACGVAEVRRVERIRAGFAVFDATL